MLYAALEKDMRGRRPTSSSAVKHAIWRICIDAKRNDWPPEWLLVAFKEAVFSLPAVQRVPRGPERDETSRIWCRSVLKSTTVSRR